jgi:hypothetical protein
VLLASALTGAMLAIFILSHMRRPDIVYLRCVPFNTEQREYVTQLAELAADSIVKPGEEPVSPGARMSPGRRRSSSLPGVAETICGVGGAENKDMYDLFGVVNHIGKRDVFSVRRCGLWVSV